MIADNTAGSIEAFVRANVKRGATLAHRRSRVLSGIDRLPSRSAHRRKNGGTCCPALDAPSLLIVEAMGPGNVSWPAAQARRHLSQRIRLSLQSSFLSGCVVRNFAWAGRASCASELLGHRQTRNPRKGVRTIRRAPRRRKTQLECDRMASRKRLAPTEISSPNRPIHYI